MSIDTVYQAYFETEKYSACIEYEPGPDGAIFILSIDIEARPISLWEQMHQLRRRGIVLDEQEQHAEAMRLYMLLEP